MEFFISVGAALLPFFILWYFSESSIEKRVREAEMEYERIVAATAARARLEILLADKPKQPELWWGDECTTISEDGKRVIHISEHSTGASISNLAAQILSGQRIEPIDTLKELATWV